MGLQLKRPKLDYTLRNGLGLEQSYAVAGYSSALDPATVGLRNLAGHVNPDGTVSLYATTSTNSNLADPGADPNFVVGISDLLDATTLPGAKRSGASKDP